MKKLLLFSFDQLLKLIGLLKPVVELVKEVIDIFKKEKEEQDEEES